MDAQNATPITHAANAASDMVFLEECANPVKVIVINALSLKQMTAQEHLGSNVLAHAKEVVTPAAMETHVQDVDQDMC
jgi:hypothetical protein